MTAPFNLCSLFTSKFNKMPLRFQGASHQKAHSAPFLLPLLWAWVFLLRLSIYCLFLLKNTAMMMHMHFSMLLTLQKQPTTLGLEHLFSVMSKDVATFSCLEYLNHRWSYIITYLNKLCSSSVSYYTGTKQHYNV